MTVSIKWHYGKGNILQYTFIQTWTWSEFLSTRKIAEAVIKRYRPNECELTDIIIDYSTVGKWIPKVPNDDVNGLHNIPEWILDEHDYITPVGGIYVVGCSDRLLKMFELIMLPAYEWETIQLSKSVTSILELT